MDKDLKEKLKKYELHDGDLEKLEQRISDILFRHDRLPGHCDQNLERLNLCTRLSGQCWNLLVGRIVNSSIVTEKNWYPHTWWDFGDGNILDLTASQFNILGFNMPLEYYGPKPENYYKDLDLDYSYIDLDDYRRYVKAKNEKI